MTSEYSAPTQFIDLAAQQERIKTELYAAVQTVFKHGQYIMGPEVSELEKQLSSFTGTRHALTCANGTDALTLVLMAWGVGPGDAVFVPSFTYVASAEAPAQLGATPFFVDVEETTFNMSPESFKQAVSDCHAHGLNPKVVVVVDLFGQPANVDAITEIAHEAGVKVLVDGAQSFGAISRGRLVGAMGDATTTSFFPAKPLGCYGDGGAVFTNDAATAATVDSIRLHGKGSEKYDNVRVGVNSRLDTLQAAILLEKLKIYKTEIALRNAVADRYNATLPHEIDTPKITADVTSVWAQYTIRTDERDSLQAYLKNIGIPSVIYYPKPLHKQLGYDKFPMVSTGLETSTLMASTVLSLPMHPYLDIEEQRRISGAIAKYFVC